MTATNNWVAQIQKHDVIGWSISVHDRRHLWETAWGWALTQTGAERRGRRMALCRERSDQRRRDAYIVTPDFEGDRP